MSPATLKNKDIQHSETIEQFLGRVEKKAYKMAEISTKDHAEALDLVQEAMLKLVTNYSEKPCKQWQPLFYRILHNKIMDWHRQQTVKRMLFFWKSTGDEEQDSQCITEQVSLGNDSPEDFMANEQLQESSVAALANLSVKQQQCFMLRSWEGLSVAETADIMQCSQGSVKTHYFRAVQKIKETLKVQHDYTF